MLTDTCPNVGSDATAVLDQAGESEAIPEGSPGVTVPCTLPGVAGTAYIDRI